MASSRCSGEVSAACPWYQESVCNILLFDGSCTQPPRGFSDEELVLAAQQIFCSVRVLECGHTVPDLEERVLETLRGPFEV